MLLSINFGEERRLTIHNVKRKIRKLTPIKGLLKAINIFIEIFTALQVNLLEGKNFSYGQ